jgi:hypothetical protein
MTNPAGESNGEALKLDYDRRLILQFRGSVVTSIAGLLARNHQGLRAPARIGPALWAPGHTVRSAPLVARERLRGWRCELLREASPSCQVSKSERKLTPPEPTVNLSTLGDCFDLAGPESSSGSQRELTLRADYCPETNHVRSNFASRRRTADAAGTQKAAPL